MNHRLTVTPINGETIEGEGLDSEIGDMRGHGIRGSQKLFSYVRYNAELSRAGLDWLGLYASSLAAAFSLR